jgi:Zn-dependent protease with chaperone function
MQNGSSLAFRAVLAVTLMVLFYALALASSALLGWLGVRILSAMWIQGRGSITIVALGGVCLVSAALIIWSVLPRFDRFKAPGREVTAAEQPLLFVEIERIAKATEQQLPAHVYLVRDVNAFVTQRGGIMGIGSRRVMGIGMPLMRTLQVDELRAVLAHEMGHFYAGDTKLGPWIYKTRGALARTVVNLAKAHNTGGHWIVMMFGVIQAPFRWFLIGYMRISQAISRAQEYSADAVAVRAEGQRALIDGLKKTHAAAVAHELYMRHEILPLVQRGALPAVGEGFSRFLANEKMTKLFDEVVAHELAEGKADPYDSHPPLRERIEAAQRVDSPTREPDTRSAIELVADPDAIESAAIAALVDRPLESVRWEDMGALWVKTWREDAKELRRVLIGMRVDAIPTERKAIYDFAVEILGFRAADSASDDDLRGWWTNAIGVALGLLLVDEGYTVSTVPGEPFRFTRGEAVVEPQIEFRRLLDGQTSADDWRARWDGLGLAHRELGAAT